MKLSGGVTGLFSKAIYKRRGKEEDLEVHIHIACE